ERRSWERYPNKGMTLTYTFYADHFEEEDEVSGRNEFSYLSIKSANEDEGHFFLFTSTNAAHMLRKDCFVQGDPAAFAAFVRKHAAVTMDPV
ncbi:YcxB family protein, partial [Acinetobacter baumannii]|nr:YcxB family protein [Acinetobacter baumannii]